MYPDIYRRIEADQDKRGKQKKKLRKLDRQYRLGLMPNLPGIDEYGISELSEDDPFDSTSVEASSCWPTDAGVMHRLL